MPVIAGLRTGGPAPSCLGDSHSSSAGGCEAAREICEAELEGEDATEPSGLGGKECGVVGDTRDRPSFGPVPGAGQGSCGARAFDLVGDRSTWSGAGGPPGLWVLCAVVAGALPGVLWAGWWLCDDVMTPSMVGTFLRPW